MIQHHNYVRACNKGINVLSEMNHGIRNIPGSKITNHVKHTTVQNFMALLRVTTRQTLEGQN